MAATLVSSAAAPTVFAGCRGRARLHLLRVARRVAPLVEGVLGAAEHGGGEIQDEEAAEGEEHDEGPRRVDADEELVRSLRDRVTINRRVLVGRDEDAARADGSPSAPASSRTAQGVVSQAKAALSQTPQTTTGAGQTTVTVLASPPRTPPRRCRPSPRRAPRRRRRSPGRRPARRSRSSPPTAAASCRCRRGPRTTASR